MMYARDLHSLLLGLVSACSLLGCAVSTPDMNDRGDMAAIAAGHPDAAMAPIDLPTPSGNTTELVLEGSPYTKTTITSVSCLTLQQTGDAYVSATVPARFSDGTVVSGGDLTLNIYAIDIQILTATSELVFEKFGSYPTGMKGTLPSTILEGASSASGQQVTLSGAWVCPP